MVHGALPQRRDSTKRRVPAGSSFPSGRRPAGSDSACGSFSPLAIVGIVAICAVVFFTFKPAPTTVTLNEVKESMNVVDPAKTLRPTGTAALADPQPPKPIPASPPTGAPETASSRAYIPPTTQEDFPQADVPSATQITGGANPVPPRSVTNPPSVSSKTGSSASNPSTKRVGNEEISPIIAAIGDTAPEIPFDCSRLGQEEWVNALGEKGKTFISPAMFLRDLAASRGGTSTVLSEQGRRAVAISGGPKSFLRAVYPVFASGVMGGGVVVESDEAFSDATAALGTGKAKAVKKVVTPDNINEVLSELVGTDPSVLDYLHVDTRRGDCHIVKTAVADGQWKAGVVALTINRSFPPRVRFWPRGRDVTGPFATCSLEAANNMMTGAGYELVQLDLYHAYFVNSRYTRVYRTAHCSSMGNIDSVWRQGYWQRAFEGGEGSPGKKGILVRDHEADLITKGSSAVMGGAPPTAMTPSYTERALRVKRQQLKQKIVEKGVKERLAVMTKTSMTMSDMLIEVQPSGSNQPLIGPGFRQR